MKKIIAVLMTAVLMLTACTCCFAAEAAPKEINWSDYTEAASKVEGKMAAVSSIGLDMFVPANFADQPLDEAAIAGGKFLLLKAEDNSVMVTGLTLPVAFDSLASVMANNGATEITPVLLNNRLALNFNLHTDGLLTPCVAMATDQGTTLMFSFTLVDPSNANSVQLVKLMAASLQTSK